jgi:hypothetical protein
VQFSLDVFVWVYITCPFAIYKFQACKSVHHRTILVNHQPDATVFQRLLLLQSVSSWWWAGERPKRVEL